MLVGHLWGDTKGMGCFSPLDGGAYVIGWLWVPTPVHLEGLGCAWSVVGMHSWVSPPLALLNCGLGDTVPGAVLVGGHDLPVGLLGCGFDLGVCVTPPPCVHITLW